MSSVDDVCGGCDWYGTACADKKCHGDGSIRYKLRSNSIIIDRIRGEYRRTKSKKPEFIQSYCLSRLVTKVSNSQIASI